MAVELGYLGKAVMAPVVIRGQSVAAVGIHFMRVAVAVAVAVVGASPVSVAVPPTLVRFFAGVPEMAVTVVHMAEVLAGRAWHIPLTVPTVLVEVAQSVSSGPAALVRSQAPMLDHRKDK